MLDTREMGLGEGASAKRNPPARGTSVKVAQSEPHSDGVGKVTVGTGKSGKLGPREQLGPLQGLSRLAGNREGSSAACWPIGATSREWHRWVSH